MDKLFLERKAYKFLTNWRANKKHECLLVKGARQVGKTELIRKFGEEEYGRDFFIELNFYERPELKTIFEDSLTPNDIYMRLSLFFPKKRFQPHKTLVFFDEIQRCAKARTALKFLAIDDQYDFIASGSLLGLRYGNDADQDVEKIESIPVGYESQLILYSLDFEEFLWAKGYSKESILSLKTYFDNGLKVPNEINSLFEKLFREYIIVGGMPYVVKKFVETNDFGVVKTEQNKILASYDDDISNHAKKNDVSKIRRCYDSLPSQLSKENKRFSFAFIEKKSGFKKYGNAISWLIDSNLVHPCHNVFEPLVPLIGNEKGDEFKLYFNDTGLLMAKYGDAAKRAILNNTMIGNSKGGIFENIISECLVKKGYSLHYYKTSDNAQEIEFIFEKDDGVIPLEVKSGNSATLSLNQFMLNFKPSVAYKLVNGNVGFDHAKHTLPHYMILFL